MARDLKKYRECLQKTHEGTLCARGYCTARQLYHAYPSAYANGYAAQVCAGTKPDLEHKMRRASPLSSASSRETKDGLRAWFQTQHWVDICRPLRHGGFAPCGREEAGGDVSHYPSCLPLTPPPHSSIPSATSLTDRERRERCAAKRREEGSRKASKRATRGTSRRSGKRPHKQKK